MPIVPSWDGDLYDDKGTAAQDDLAQVSNVPKLAEFSGKLTGKTGDELAEIIAEYQGFPRFCHGLYRTQI